MLPMTMCKRSIMALLMCAVKRSKGDWPQKFNTKQRNAVSPIALSVAFVACFLVALTPRRAQSQNTVTLPLTYSIGAESSDFPSYLFDDSWNFVHAGGNTYMVGFSNQNWSAWSICEGTTLDNFGCPSNSSGGYYDTTPQINNGATGWPPLGGTEQGTYWPDGIYVDPSSGTWYTAVHVEFNYNNSAVANEAHFRGIGLATSTDLGKDWTWQGWIVTSPNPTGEVNQFPGMYYDYGPGDCELTLGNDGYIYLFYGEAWVRKGDFIRYLAGRVARAPLVANLPVGSTTNIAPGTWTKYFNGTWTQAGAGGYGSDVFFGTGTANVVYDSYLGKFIVLGQTGESLLPAFGGSDTLATASSLAAENWTPQMSISQGDGDYFLLWYNQSVDPTTYNANTVGQSFRVYASADAGSSYPAYNQAEYYPFSFGAGNTTGAIYNYPYPLEPVNDGNAPYRGIDMAMAANNPGASISASSNNGNLATHANDGNLTTAWIAGSGTMSLSNPQTLTVDLGTAMPLGSVKQNWNETDDSTFQYQILGSNDDVTWTLLADRSGGVQQSNSVNPVAPLVANVTDAASGINDDVTLDNVYGNYRWVRLSVDGITNSHWASSAEFGVYLADDIALGTYASANSTASGSQPNNAIDNLLTTAWIASGTPSAGAPQTLTINLGAPQPIGAIIQRFNDTDNSTYYFKISGSNDDSTWQTIVDYTSTGHVGPLSVTSAGAGGNYGSWQYLQLYVTDITNGHSASSREFEAFYPSAGPIVSGKTYRIVNLNSGRNLEIPDGQGIGVQADQSSAACNNDQSYCTWQEWMASYQGNNQWAFVNVNNQNVLEVNGSNGNIDTWGFGDTANQLWTLQSSGAGTYKIVNTNSNEIVTVEDASYSNGEAIIQWSNANNWSTNSEWTFVPVN